MLSSIFSNTASNVTLLSFIICSVTSIVLGIAVALVHRVKNPATKGFVITLAVIPLIVQTVIMMVNGNLGAGIAVAGAFSLIRFRSAPGTARDICSLFLSVAIGLATGTGFIAIAVILAVVVCTLLLIFKTTNFGNPSQKDRELKIVIPESLDYSEVFDDLFEKYTSYHELENVKTTDLGSLFKLTYEIRLKDPSTEKQFIDELRCRNGNLDISCGRAQAVKNSFSTP